MKGLILIVKIPFREAGTAAAEQGTEVAVPTEAPESEAVETVSQTDDVVAERSTHRERLRQRKDGPYYVTPDSVEPLPSGMWADLERATVEATAADFPDLVDPTHLSDTGEGAFRHAIPKRNREFLERDGSPEAKRLLAELGRGL